MSLNQDYKNFLNSEDVAPPEELSNSILKRIQNDLKPSASVVFFKLLAIQGLIGTLTLLFCPQFGLSLTNNHELFHFFHRTFGELVCNAICGSIFIGSGAVFAGFLLKKSELSLAFHSFVLFSFLITGTALTILILFGAKLYLSAAVIWGAGAIVSELIIISASKHIKTIYSLQS